MNLHEVLNLRIAKFKVMLINHGENTNCKGTRKFRFFKENA
jgi:hypothetical protein